MEFVQQSFSIIKDVDSIHAVLALLILCGTGYLMYKINFNTKALKTEEAEKEVRKLERDKQMNALNCKIKEVDDKGENYMALQTMNDERTQKTLYSIEQRLTRLEDNLIEKNKFEKLQDKVQHIEVLTEKTLTILQERFKK